jgi:PEP-CTERM motif
MLIRSIVALAATAALGTAASATTLVQWDLAGAPGNQATTPGIASDASLAAIDLSRGAGLSPSAASNSFSSSGFTGGATDFVSLGFTVASGFLVDLDALFIGTRSSNTGPGTIGLYWSGDAFATPITRFDQSPGSNFVNSVVDLSALPDLTGSVEFRLAQIGSTSANGGATGASGTFRLTGYFNDSGFDRNLQFTGSVAAIPEPGTYGLMAAGLAAMGLFIRRRQA